jgi:hypothetical protein
MKALIIISESADGGVSAGFGTAQFFSQAFVLFALTKA